MGQADGEGAWARHGSRHVHLGRHRSPHVVARQHVPRQRFRPRCRARSVRSVERRPRSNASKVPRQLGEGHEHQVWHHREHDQVSTSTTSTTSATIASATFASESTISAFVRPVLPRWLLWDLSRWVVWREQSPLRRKLQWKVVPQAISACCLTESNPLSTAACVWAGENNKTFA